MTVYVVLKVSQGAFPFCLVTTECGPWSCPKSNFWPSTRMLLHASMDDAGVMRSAKENKAAAASAVDDFAVDSLIVETSGPPQRAMTWNGSGLLGRSCMRPKFAGAKAARH